MSKPIKNELFFFQMFLLDLFWVINNFYYSFLKDTTFKGRTVW